MSFKFQPEYTVYRLEDREQTNNRILFLLCFFVRYKTSAQKQLEGSNSAFSVWAGGLRQRQLDGVDDEVRVKYGGLLFFFSVPLFCDQPASTSLFLLVATFTPAVRVNLAASV